jgi:hypothetical protein
VNAFGAAAKYDYSPYWNDKLLGGRTFIHGDEAMGMHEFTNYLVGYCAYDNSPNGLTNIYCRSTGLAGTFYGLFDTSKRIPGDLFAHQYYLAKGMLDSNVEHFRGLGAQLDRITLKSAVWQYDCLRQFDYWDNHDQYIP